MRQFRELWQYISFRAAIMGTIAVTVLPVCAYAAGLQWGKRELRPFFLLLTACVMILLLAWLLVVKPYLHSERERKLYLEGYGFPGDGSEQLCHLSPSSRLLLAQWRKIVNPSHLFHLNKRQAQYLALQNQINPHFLYNTLESIRSEAMLAGLDGVADMTEALATFFRYTITKVENLVSVEEELENCKTYFSIQEYRFGERLTLEIRCAPEDKGEIYHCRLPKLTMQPILENSIIHGTELKIGTGHLIIHLERTRSRLLIRISDNGVGMDEETLARLNRKLNRGSLSIVEEKEQTSQGGMALVNVNNRIRLLFGDEYGLHVFSVPGVGTDVEITLPAILSDRDVTNKEALQ